MVTGASVAGGSISGCVFFIWTAGFAGGSGNTVMPAVSFFDAGVVIGAGIAAVAARAEEGESAGANDGFAGGRVGKWIRTVSRDSTGRAGGAPCCGEP